MSTMEEGVEEPQRYFCHQCNMTCIPEPPEYLCPTCNEGFIEPVAVSPLPRPSPGIFPTLPPDLAAGGFRAFSDLGPDPMDHLEALRSMHNQFTQIRTDMQELRRRAQAQGEEVRGAAGSSDLPHTGIGSGSEPPQSRSAPGSRGPSGSSDSAPTSRVASASASPTPGPRLSGHTHNVHSSNVAPNSSVAGRVPGLFGPGSSRVSLVLGDVLGGQDGANDIPTLFSMIMAGLNGDQQPLAGNPGDYAWGPGGLDNIISQLIGQLDGSGPPPAQEHSIESLPDVYIPKKHLDNKLDCTVCQEFFTSEEKVKELPCNHYFHIDCIIPWLKLHNSCPICRLSIEGQPSRGSDVTMTSPGEEVLPDLSPDDDTTSTTMTQSIHEDDLD